LICALSGESYQARELFLRGWQRLSIAWVQLWIEERGQFRGQPCFGREGAVALNHTYELAKPLVKLPQQKSIECQTTVE
jgi:hypothetical protein